jgi:hypothetical protein
MGRQGWGAVRCCNITKVSCSLLSFMGRLANRSVFCLTTTPYGIPREIVLLPAGG